MCDTLWLDRVEWVPAENDGLQNDRRSSSREEEVVLLVRTSGAYTLLLRAYGNAGDASSHHRRHSVLRLHPLLYEFLSSVSPTEEDLDGFKTRVEIAPLPFPEFPTFGAAIQGTMKMIPIEERHILPGHSILTLKVIYIWDACAQKCRAPEEELYSPQIYLRALWGRVICKGSVVLLLLPSFNGVTVSSSLYALVIVHEIAVAGDNDTLCYTVGEGIEYAVQLTKPCSLVDKEEDDDTALSSSPVHASLDCPGYAALQASLRNMLQLVPHPAAPSGVLLTGPAGVGKTRLVRSILPSSSEIRYHYVSIQEVRLRAGYSEAMVESLLQPPHDCTVLILDDLQVLSSTSNTNTDIEGRLIMNCLIQIMDQQQQSSSSGSLIVVGIARDTAAVPPELLRAGRLETEVTMPPPTQMQREEILYHLLQSTAACGGDDAPTKTNDGDDDPTQTYRHWARLLATVTAGFVASDLRCLCADAWSRQMARLLLLKEGEDKTEMTHWDDALLSTNVQWNWDDLAEAARNISPSQLAMLDVTKPKDFLDVCSLDDWLRIHQLSWEMLAGYETVKQRVYRTVVVPWRRQMSRGPQSSADGLTIVPPSGILFHGPSGCGKTMAANCLGSSLGLPMIKVRASDVLDQWLGGSEATLRSLFARARASAPCILFLDELDALASNRSNAGDGSDVMSRLLSTFLNEMDGVSNNPQSDSRVLIVACTNRIHMLDAALLRPGRLEEHIMLPLPTFEDSLAILRKALGRAPADVSIDWSVIAENLVKHSASGADMEGMCREAIFRAMRRCSADDSTIMVCSEDITNAMVAMKLSELPLHDLP